MTTTVRDQQRMEKALIYTGESVSLSLLDNGIAELGINTKKSTANLLDSDLCDELFSAITAAKENKHTKGLLIYSQKSTFCLGANINEIADLLTQSKEAISPWVNQFHSLFLAIEELPFPTLAAIDSMALGGGFELALACDFRTADNQAKVGLPEINLGLCPGWGGTVRLPRLIGLENALSWITDGKPRLATVAFEQGTIDLLAEKENLLVKSEEFLQSIITDGSDQLGNRRTAKKLSDKSPVRSESLKIKLASYIDKNHKHANKLIERLVLSNTLNFSDALTHEETLFCDLANSLLAKNLIQVFLSTQSVKRKVKNTDKYADAIQKAAVAGAGIMGGGIAYQSAKSAMPVLIKDIDSQSLAAGLETIVSLLDGLLAKGKITQEVKKNIVNNLQTTMDYNDFPTIDCVIEAVTETFETKVAVLTEIEEKIRPTAILATNTSTISISRLADRLQRPENFCGMHFFNPVHAMPLVEIIVGAKTSDSTVAQVTAYAAKMGKTPIVVCDCPGFLVNRVLFPYFNAFNRLLMDGVEFQKIDSVMEAFGWPMGPAYLADVIGLDTMIHADKVLEEGFPERMGHDERPIIESLAAEGHLGQKTGCGFYRYNAKKKKEGASTAVTSIIGQRVERSIVISDEEIIERMMIPMCIEAIHCLEEGIVDSVDEIDLALVLGLGFPRYRGGIFSYIDNLGLQHFAERVYAHRNVGAMYSVTPGFTQRLQANESFYP